jgi:hypothetical protein
MRRKKMSRTVEGIICFGVLMDEESQVPWNQKEYSYDIDDWWLFGICKFKPTEEIFNKDGSYIDPKPTRKQIDGYFNEERKFKKDHPLPIQIVRIGNSEEPRFIIAAIGTVTMGHLYDPYVLPAACMDVKTEDVDILLHFCIQYQIEYIGKPSWYLAAYSD